MYIFGAGPLDTSLQPEWVNLVQIKLPSVPTSLRGRLYRGEGKGGSREAWKASAERDGWVG